MTRFQRRKASRRSAHRERWAFSLSSLRSSERTSDPLSSHGGAIECGNAKINLVRSQTLDSKKYRPDPIRAWASSTIRSMTAAPSSRPAAGSASIGRKSTSQPCLPARRSASNRSQTTSGSSASCTTIWATSTTRPVASSPSTTRLRQKCYLCLRYKLLPMSSERTPRKMARPTGFEPVTPAFGELNLSNV